MPKESRGTDRKNPSRYATLLVLVTVLFWSSDVRFAHGFKPKDERGHAGIVTNGLKDISRITAQGNTLKFSARAILQIRDATAGVDDLTGPSAEFINFSAHCDNELLPECSGRIRDIRQSIIDNLKDDATRNGAEARRQLGRALHTLQDFYSHSNWIELGNGAPSSGLVAGTLGALGLFDQTCDILTASFLTEFGLTSITTGYFPIFVPGKCLHGVFPFQGIHKDFPGRTGFDDAEGVATAATESLVEGILNASGVAGNDLAIAEFMDALGTVGLIIDDTGSMGPEISGVKVAAADIVNFIESNPDIVPTDFLLERYGDPDVGTPFVTKSASALVTAVNAISPSGGGDCPELAQEALFRAVNGAEVRSQLFFFSDASSKDASKSGKVLSAANKKKTVINYVLTGSCSPVDPAYVAVAQGTGGQVFLIFSSETNLIFSLIEPALRGDLEPILIVKDVHDGSAKEYIVPVDSTVSSATFSVSSDVLSSAQVFRPTGIAVSPSDPDATVTSLSTGQITTVSSPEVGDWRLVVSGTGDLFVSILGNGPISLNNFDFVEERGREGHTGLFPILGQPVVSSESSLAVSNVIGPIGTADFELRSESGEVIQTIELLSGDIAGIPGTAFDDFVGDIVLPTERFRVYVLGTDEGGDAYQRAFPQVFLARSVSIEPDFGLLEVTPGGTFTVTLLVTNLGAMDTFAISASQTFGPVTSVSPSSVTLNEGESAEVVVVLTVPDDVETGARGLLSAEAQGSGGVESNNTTTIDLLVTEIDFPTTFLVLDADAIDNGTSCSDAGFATGAGCVSILECALGACPGVAGQPVFNDPAVLVNDDIASIPGVAGGCQQILTINSVAQGAPAQDPMPAITLPTGQSGDEGLFSPAPNAFAGVPGGLPGYVDCADEQTEDLLGGIALAPLDAAAVFALESSRVCAVVHNSDISDLGGGFINAMGARNGRTAFDVNRVIAHPDGGSRLPVLEVEFLDANEVDAACACANLVTVGGEPFDCAP